MLCRSLWVVGGKLGGVIEVRFCIEPGGLLFGVITLDRAIELQVIRNMPVEIQAYVSI